MAAVYWKVIISAFLVVFAVFQSASASDAQASDSGGWTRRALITGVPVEAKEVRRHGELNRMILAGTYRVQLKDIDVVYGVLASNRAVLDLVASEPSAITGHRRIFVLVETAEDGVITARRWGGLTSIICMPNELVDEFGVREDFFEFAMLTGQLCTNAEWHR